MASNKPQSVPKGQKKTLLERLRTTTSKFSTTDRRQAEASSTLSVYNSFAEASIRLPDSTTSDQHTTLDPSTIPPSTSLASLNLQHECGSDNAPFQDEYCFYKDIIIKATNDSNDCFIVAMASISDKDIIMCDKANKSVKMINIDTDVITGYVSFSTKPRDLTSLNTTDVAVCFPKEEKIKMLSTKGGLFVKGQIKVNGECLSITFCRDELYVVYWNPVRLQILSLKGSVRKTIIPDSECLKCPRHIAVNITDTTGIIYLSDWKQSVIVSIDLNGTMLAMYKDEGLVVPYDITFTPFGSIYVCNSDEDVIYKMSEDLSECLVILNRRDGLVKPFAMCFCPGRKSLFISSRNGAPKYCDVIKQFKYD